MRLERDRLGWAQEWAQEWNSRAGLGWLASRLGTFMQIGRRVGGVDFGGSS